MITFIPTKKRLTALLLVLPMLLCVGCDSLVLNADMATADVLINEVVSSNAHSLVDETLGTPDWIELYNASGAPVDLSGYGLSDNLKEPHKWTFPEVTLAPGSFLLVYACKAQQPMCAGFGLAKSGETLYLSDSYYNLLQTVVIPALDADISYARNDAGEFGYCAAPTPGAPNTGVVPSLSDIVYAGSDALELCEVLPQNVRTLACEDGAYYPYVKLHSLSDAPVSLAAFYLSDNRADPLKWQMPDTTVAPGGFALIFLSGKDKSGDEMHAGFKLGSADDTLFLSDAQGIICGSLTWSLDILEDIAVVANGAYTAFPSPNGENDARTFTQTALSDMDETDPVRISEILVKNRYSAVDEDGDRGAWVELYNASAETVSLDGYTLSDNADNPLKWAFPADAAIEANAYLVVYLDGKDRAGAYLHTPFSLSAKDGQLLFVNKNGLRADVAVIDPSIGENIAVGRGASGWVYYATPTPGAKNSAHAFETMGAVALPNMNGVYISEVCGVNAAKSGKSDWIELHNASSHDVNLSGWHLSDDADDLFRFALPDLSLPAGGYTVIHATAKSEKPEGVTAPFAISDGGETLFLLDADDEIADIFATGALRAGVTSGRAEGNAARVFFVSATKGGANGSAYEGSYVMAPVLSDLSLYHTESFQLTIQCPTKDATLYYTTDGSKPSVDSSGVYTAPLTISKNTILKVKAVKSGLPDSEIMTATYLFTEPHTLPVVCLSADSASWSQVYSVIDRWEKVEREGYCEYFESDGALGVKFPCGLRANGASTLLARQKSLSIFLRAGYGVGETHYPFFTDSGVDVYHSLCVRNSGQDRDKARMRDSLFAKAVRGLNIETVATRPVIVYVNAQYWGIYDLNENQNEDFMATHYGVDPDAVDIIRRNETRLAGEKRDFLRVRAYALNTDLSDNAKFAEFAEWVDVDYFTDYLIAQTFFANGDMFNQKYWRSQDSAIKWRPVFFDLDLGLSGSNPSRNILPSYFTYEGVPSQDGSLTNMDIFVGLRKNAAWCDKFCARYVYVVEHVLTAERLSALADEMIAQLKPEMARHIQKWGSPSSVSAWEKSAQALRDCLAKRHDYALKNLKNEFKLTDAQMQAYTQAAQTAG